ncbi:hypothetical protein HMPREF1869_00052 [Bacteroidales bacterium KA00251]|nr:hypothetical protein HMPREF1869_00052 [Bacteroidales bacterium KA00251]
MQMHLSLFFYEDEKMTLDIALKTLSSGAPLHTKKIAPSNKARTTL